MDVCDVQSLQFNAFADNDLKVMETLADQIAVTIVDVQWYQPIGKKYKSG